MQGFQYYFVKQEKMSPPYIRYVSPQLTQEMRGSYAKIGHAYDSKQENTHGFLHRYKFPVQR